MFFINYNEIFIYSIDNLSLGTMNKCNVVKFVRAYEKCIYLQLLNFHFFILLHLGRVSLLKKKKKNKGTALHLEYGTGVMFIIEMNKEVRVSDFYRDIKRFWQGSFYRLIRNRCALSTDFFFQLCFRLILPRYLQVNIKNSH